MKNKLKLIPCLLILILVVMALVACNNNNGQDSPAPPKYNIASVQDLLDMQEMVGDKYSNTLFNLTKDIDLQGIAFIPIGYSFDKAFTGTFLGNGHTISNLKINDTEEKDGAGLFGYVKDATFSDLTITNLEINYTATKLLNFTGGLYGYGYGYNSVNNFQVDGSIRVKNTWEWHTSPSSGVDNEECNQIIYAGGILGYNKGSLKLENAQVNVDIAMVPCPCSYEIMSIPFKNAFVGGAIGFVTGIDGKIDSNIKNITVNSQNIDVSASIAHIGGLAGYLSNAYLADSNANVSNIKFSTDIGIDYRANIGGLSGYTLNSVIENIIIKDTIIESLALDVANLGGIIGYADKTQLKNSHAKNLNLVAKKITYSGGIVGILRYSRTMNDSDNAELGYEKEGESLIEYCTATGGLYKSTNLDNIDQPTGKGYDYNYDGCASMIGLIWGDSKIDNCYTDFVSLYGIIAEKKAEQGVDSDGDAIVGKHSEPIIGEELFYTQEANLSQKDGYINEINQDELYPKDEWAKSRTEIADLITSLLA